MPARCYCTRRNGADVAMGLVGHFCWVVFLNLFEEPKIPHQPEYLKISTAVCSEKVKVISFPAMI